MGSLAPITVNTRLKIDSEYIFKVTDPQEVDIQRICDENPESPIILVITESHAALLISKELLSRFEQMNRDVRDILNVVVLGDTLDDNWGAPALIVCDSLVIKECYSRSKALRDYRAIAFIKEHIPQALKELGSACAKLGTRKKVEKHTIEVKAFSMDGSR